MNIGFEYSVEWRPVMNFLKEAEYEEGKRDLKLKSRFDLKEEWLLFWRDSIVIFGLVIESCGLT